MDITAFDFESVFDPDDYIYFYKEWLTEERSNTEVESLEKIAELSAPMKILDLACGFGRHTNRLAAKGHKLTGLDLIPEFLNIARKDAERLSLSVNYMQGDMRSISFTNEFDRVFLLFTAYGYFEDEENLLVLKNCAKALKPGGLLVFDIPNRDGFLIDFKRHNIIEKEGNLMIDNNSFDTVTGRMYDKRIVIRNGIKKDKPFFVRLYNPTEIRHSIKEAGLKLYKQYGGWDEKPLSLDSTKMVTVAKKA